MNNQIGDTRIRILESGYKAKETFMPCTQCGKGRWQVLRHSVTNRPICRACSSSNRMKNPDYKEKILAGLRRRWARIGEKERMSQMMSGKNNHFYGKKWTEEMRFLLSKPKIKVNIGHTKEWGYIIGLVLGDGCVRYKKNGNYEIVVASTKPEIVDIFYECALKLKLHCIYSIRQQKARGFKKVDGIRYDATVLSKKLYLYLRPYKYKDFRFTIPDIIYRHKDMASGFLQGFFDADGGVYLTKNSYTYKGNIQCWSKHVENLTQVKELLETLGILSYVHKEKKKQTSARLTISDYANRILFRELVGFRIKRKQERLDSMKAISKRKSYTIEQYSKVIELRERGFTAYEIQEQTGVNHNTAVGWYWAVANNRLPRTIRQQITHIKNDKELEMQLL